MNNKFEVGQRLRHKRFCTASIVKAVQPGRVLVRSVSQDHETWYADGYVRTNYELVDAPGLPLEDL